MPSTTTTIGEYLITRLEQLKLGHVFGIPGDYVLSFYDRLVNSQLKVIGTCTEIGAGFAADGYARVNGLGCVCVTYCVGGLNAVNAIAGAYAEKSPVVMISGAPGMGEREQSPLLHHQVRDFKTQYEMYRHVTSAACQLESGETAPQQIDDTLVACLRHKRPVYIELPRDMVDATCDAPVGRLDKKVRQPLDKHALEEAVSEAARMLKAAKKPTLLAGVELHRFSLQEPLLELVEQTRLPVAATLLGKSVIRENHPQYLGVYEGALGTDRTRKAIEGSDCVLILGAFMTDINLGIYTARLDVSKTINATSERISISRHHYDDVPLDAFISGLSKALEHAKLQTPKVGKADVEAKPMPITPRPSKAITVKRFFARMNSFLDDNTVVISDIGDSLFGAADLMIHRRTEFISPAYYTSMGFAVPAAIGAQIKDRTLRPIVFVGDGAFQMTGHEVSTIARYGLNPIIFVLNNKGYTTERFIHEGPYNDVHEWAYHLWPQLVRKGWGAEVRTEGELEEAITTARTNTTGFSILNVHLEKLDTSQALVRLGKRLGKRAGLQ